MRIIGWLILLTCLCLPAPSVAATPLKPGAEQLGQYLPLLQGKRVGLLVNQTSLVDGQHLVDVLLANKVNIVSIFAPEHGFRGDHDAGAQVSNGVDSKTGLPLWSLYGASKQPSAAQMQQLDIVIFDIVTVINYNYYVRYIIIYSNQYTYIDT